MSTRPLEGLRILEFGGYIAVPYCSALLGALGAEVIKVERPIHGDEFRRGMGERSAYFRQYNAGKLSVGVNLKSPDGVAAIKALLPTVDVVTENMRPGKMQALGLGSDDCRAIRSDLIYASITGFGSGGPLVDRPAYDTIGQAYGGLYTVLSDAGRPQLSGTPIGDLITGFSAASGILAALVGRGRTGSPGMVETSLLESVSTLTIDALSQYFDDGHRDPARQSRHPQAQNFVLDAAEGDAIALHLSSSQKFWHALLTAANRPDLVDDPRFATYEQRVRNYAELDEILTIEFAQLPSDEWQERLTAHDVPHAPVLRASGFVNHPQVKWLELMQPETDGVALVRPPWKFDGERPTRPTYVPRVGEHTRTVFDAVLSYDELARLTTAGVLDDGTTPQPDAVG